jgi:hypothetical protein
MVAMMDDFEAAKSAVKLAILMGPLLAVLTAV